MREERGDVYQSCCRSRCWRVGADKHPIFVFTYRVRPTAGLPSWTHVPTDVLFHSYVVQYHTSQLFSRGQKNVKFHTLVERKFHFKFPQP